ncbi:hypothetical protein N7456_013718 [Penicillium angulare]|uniref:Uncharacterized protein n=1 Tax=Penicillium angulare TaxID=116970 RepID=A0A9W9EFS2_9EURO|nr:hypothetical protein N7456_013718 [Penicillium angulare]
MSSGSTSNPGSSGLRSIRLSQYIFGIQAVPLLASGIYTLLRPNVIASLANSPFRGIDTGTIQAISLTSIALGACQTIAAYQNNIPMMLVTVPGRLLGAFVFHRSGGEWRKMAPFEGLMGLLIAIGVYWTWDTERADKEDRKD